ncbi:MAG TPA: aminotransferase class V-fold PLP-dependent enzyme [Gemmatimonadaceae bacterium]|nr:aminotransferase class V-fold PLP-dependent enzyme [Gemmatimonadaceae bacterium]
MGAARQAPRALRARRAAPARAPRRRCAGGAQTAGHLALDLRAMACDAYFTSAHKWLCAPIGTGFLYVRREVQARLWTTLASARWDDHADEGFRLMQHGTASRSVLEGFDAALDFHAALGGATVEARALALGARLRAGRLAVPGVRVTSPLAPELLTGATVWAVDGLTGTALQERLWMRGRIRVRSQGAGVRQCCHLYNLPEELDRTLALAAELAADVRRERGE